MRRASLRADPLTPPILDILPYRNTGGARDGLKTLISNRFEPFVRAIVANTAWKHRTQRLDDPPTNCPPIRPDADE